MRAHLLASTALLCAAVSAQAAPTPSAFVTRPDDPKAIVVDAKGDGRADAGKAIQDAIDKAAAKGEGGIVFLPSGRYRLTKSLFLWTGVRIFGFGPTRPVLVLPDNTPGFDKGVATMVIFSGGRGTGNRRVAFPPRDSVPFDDKISDANPGTFYSAMSNIDIEIGAGNAGAVGIRFHAAQHAYLAHMDFRIGSGLAGVYQVANEAEDLHFHGGRYGILAEKPSPAWQFTLIDSSFDGQREAAIREHEASLTLVNASFRNVPVGIDIDEGYSDWLWGKDVRFENISRAAVVISNENNVYTQVGFENAVASRVPTFARFRESGKTVAGPAAAYRVKAFNYGLTLPGLGATGAFKTNIDATPLKALPAPGAPAVRLLPPTTVWANVRDLGAKGDGKTDDTAALQKAIDTHRVVYLPQGFYQVSDTLRLKPDSVLVALHPNQTQIILPDSTPGYQGIGGPKALLQSADGGDAIVSGIGLFTSGINPRATALLWTAGENSLVQDVKFQGGHGTALPDGKRFSPYNANSTGDADPRKRWDAQYPSLWITRGGGGTFTNLWTPDTYAQAGMYVSDTKTPGHVYQVSAEHHVRTEFAINRVENWEFLAAQTEEEGGEGPDALSFEIRNSKNVLLANYHGYRVTRTYKPVPTAIAVYDSENIRFRNVHVNSESGLGACDAQGCGTFLRLSKFPAENAIQDRTSKLDVREREFAVLDLPANPTAPPPERALGAKVEKLEGNFWSISGGAVDAQGRLYFVENRFHRIYSYSAKDGLNVERDASLDPVNLAFDQSGNLMVLSSDGAQGTVYAFKPGMRDDQVTVIPPVASGGKPDAIVTLPVNYWNNGEFRDQLDFGTYRFTTIPEMFARDMALPKAQLYVSPDGGTVLPAFRTWAQGNNFLGRRFSDALDTYGFTQAKAGTRAYLISSSENRTYSGLVHADGSVTDLKAFAPRGGESVVAADNGNVFVANGQIFVYDPAGKPLGQIDVPERPLQLLIGGPDRRTLFILTHHSLYATKI
jgi:hypothetical protein